METAGKRNLRRSSVKAASTWRTMGTPLSISGQWVSYDWYDDNAGGQECEGKKQLFYEYDLSSSTPKTLA